MPHTIKDAKKRDVSVNINTADNGGVIVRCSWHEEAPCEDNCKGMTTNYKDKTYIYDSLEEALKDIPGMISVKQDMDESDEIDRKMMREED